MSDIMGGAGINPLAPPPSKGIARKVSGRLGGRGRRRGGRRS